MISAFFPSSSSSLIFSFFSFCRIVRKSRYDDVEELEDEDGLFCFLVADLCLKILLLMLEISFSLPYPLLGLPVKEILAKEELGLSPCSVSWLILTFFYTAYLRGTFT